MSAKRILGTLLAVAIVAATLVARQATPVDRHRNTTHGCQAAGPGGAVATLEAAGVADAVHHSSSAPAAAPRTGSIVRPTADGGRLHSALSFPRPHDPQHLHAFSLLI
jgi:hypothetical protein